MVVIGGGRPGGVARCGVVLGNGGNGWRGGTLLAGGGGGAVRCVPFYNTKKKKTL